MSEIYDQTLALGGLFQSLRLVQNIAKTGVADDDDDVRCVISSLLVTSPKNTIDVFQSERALTLGLRSLQKDLSSPDYTNSEISRYLINVIALSQKLIGDRTAWEKIGLRIDSVKRQQDFNQELKDPLSPPIIDLLASIYVDLISPLGSKIQVVGTPDVLKQTAIQSKIRALLLAGVRSAVLWNQVGGKKRHLLFNRKQIIEEASLILQHRS